MPLSRTLPLLSAAVLVLACGRRDRAPAGDTAGAGGPSDSFMTCDTTRVPPVTTAGVGAVHLYGRIADIRRGCVTRDTTVRREGMPERATVVRYGPHSIVAITTGSTDTSVTQILITDRAFHTDQGIGVGNTVGELRQRHGRICTAVGEGRVIAFASALPGVSFVTDVAPGARGRHPGATALPDSARITSLLVTSSTFVCAGPVS